CTIAYWHRARFSSGTHGSDAALRRIWHILYTAGADVVVSGHDHDYERFGPQTPSGAADSARGLVQFVAGTGGARLRRFHVFPAAHSLVRIAGRFGVLKLELGNNEYQWEFIATDGRVYDTGRAACH
ncbi:MAG: alkaline phosphatase, partial [Gemmatimonadetes bacterium]|nr:alkaline phosphatase [Gemmatimonadota bacterium]